jgi:hypothetical protein
LLFLFLPYIPAKTGTIKIFEKPYYDIILHNKNSSLKEVCVSSKETVSKTFVEYVNEPYRKKRHVKFDGINN